MNIDIEKKAVGAVRDICVDNPYLDPELNENDRSPIWDGAINIYVDQHGNHSVDNFIAKVPVQIKGKRIGSSEFPISIKHPIRLSDVRAYLNSNGCFYFVVAINKYQDDIQTKVYYRDFYQSDLLYLIDQYGKQQTTTLEFQLFPTDHISQANLLLNYEKTYKTGSFLVENNMFSNQVDLSNFDSFEFKYFFVESDSGSLRPPLHYITKSTFTLFGKLNQDYSELKIPVRQVNVIRAIQHVPCLIGAGTKIYFNNARKSWHKGNLEYQLNNICTIFIVYDNPIKINISIKPLHKLSDQLLVANFLRELISTETLSIDNRLFELPSLGDSNQELANYCDWIISIKTKLESLGIQEDLIVDLNNQALEHIELLLHVDGDVLVNYSTKNKISIISIGNIKVLVIIEVVKEGLLIKNFFDSNAGDFVFKISEDDNKTYEESRFIILDRQSLIVNNFNVDVVISDIERYEINAEMLGYYNQLGLECLSVFDTTNSPPILQLAIEIFRILQSKFPQKDFDFLKLNYYQSVFRETNSSEEYRDELLNIMANHSEDPTILMGCHILLTNYEEARNLISKMESVDSISEWPIMSLLKD